MGEKFHRAARDGYLDLLKEGTRKDMNTADEDGNTPTLLAAHHGNMDALRMIIMRGGDPNKMDLLGYTALHHAAKIGHMNCVSFLINFGANIWAFDNDLHSALDAAAMENHDDIVKFLDEAHTAQQRKNPKIVQSLKEKAIKNAERNAKYYERLQDKATRELAKSRKHEQKVHRDPDFKAPNDASLFTKISLRIKSTNSRKWKQFNGENQQFSDYAISRKSGSERRSGEITSVTDFHVSEMDESGKRTVKSLQPAVATVKRDGQVMYLTNKGQDDGGARPAISNVFPNTSLGTKAFSTQKHEPNPIDDSGIDSFENDEEEAPSSIFSRSGFGAGVSMISFRNRFDTMDIVPDSDTAADDADGALVNGDAVGVNGEAGRHSTRISSGTESIGTTGSQDLPWQDDDVEALDDDEQETEYSQMILFLESCGLSHYTEVFTSEDVDMEALMLLTNQDFQDYGIPLGPRRKLMDAIQRRKLTLKSPPNIHDTHL